MSSTHRCPGPGCAAEVPRSMLACRRHWSQVSRPVQREVYAAYREEPGGPAHAAAMDDAVAEMTA